MVIDSSFLEFSAFEVGGGPLFSCEVELEYCFLPLGRLKMNKLSESSVKKALRSEKNSWCPPKACRCI